MPYLNKISDYVYLHSEQRGDHEAIVWKQSRFTYQQLAGQVKALSKALIAAGVTKGDRIAMLGSPRPEFLITFMAAVDIGAIWMGLHPRYQLAEFRHVIELAEPTLIFAFEEIDGRQFHDEMSTLKNDYGFIREVIWLDDTTQEFGLTYSSFIQSGESVQDVSWENARSYVEPDDSAVIIFTSGTTGKPKGAMNSHYGLIHCAHIELSRWPSDDMRVLQNMPINHIANIGMMTSYALVAGGTLVFMDRFDPGDILKVIEQEKITFWLQSPAMFHLAVVHPDFETTDLSSLEYIIWGGGPMPQHLVEFLHGLGAQLAMAYGMTELTAYATYADLDASPEAMANSIGRPESRYDLRLMTKNGSLAEEGESGEIQARGRWLMNGYFNQPDATAEAYTEDGWFKTGDVAALRPDGNWQLVGRLKEMYKSGGYNIYPREIEIAIEQHPDVAMSAVIGVKDTVYDEVGYAFVQPEPGKVISSKEIDQWCRERLANYKIPKTFEMLSELPRLPIGKIDKQLLIKNLQSPTPETIKK